MEQAPLRQRLLNREVMAGLFVRTASQEVIELLSIAGVDFFCLDSEHGVADRAGMNIALGMAKALGLTSLVRVTHAAPAPILQALDMGADGIVVPHVLSVALAKDVARWSRYGHGGRGAAGNNRWGGYTTTPMPELVRRSHEATGVIVMIEDPEGVDAVEEIAAVDGIDGMFIGAGDLSVAYGEDSPQADSVQRAFDRVAAAGKAAGKTVAAVAPNPAAFQTLIDREVTMSFVGSEQSALLEGARAIANLTKT